MKIDSYEIGEHCFGKILRVNGVDYEDLDKKEVIAFILERFEKDINREILIEETFQNLLEHLQYDCVEDEISSCDQCGNYNFYSKYKNEQL